MNDLAQLLQRALPEVVKQFNQQVLPALETQVWRRSARQMFSAIRSDQISVEKSKQFNWPINNLLIDTVNQQAGTPVLEDTQDRGQDLIYLPTNTPIEDKNTFGSGAGWTGNGFDKTDWHLLKKFHTNDDCRIIDGFACLVDLSKTVSRWGDKNGRQRVGLNLASADRDHIIVIWGSLECKRKWARPVAKEFSCD